MAISIINSAKNQVRANTQTVGITVTHGFTLANGDVLYAFIGMGDDPGTGWVDSLSAWTQLGNVAGTSGNDGALGIMRKVITDAGSEPSSYTFRRSGNNATDNLIAIVVQVRGADPTTPEDQTTPTPVYGANSFVPNNVDITTQTDNACVLVAHLAIMTLAQWDTAHSAGAPSTYSIVDSHDYDDNTNVSSLFLEVAADTDVGTAGPQSIGVWTGTGNSGSEYITCAVAVKLYVSADSRAQVSWAEMEVPEATGTTYPQSVSGAITPAAVVIHQDRHLLTAALSPAGVIARFTAALWEGSITPSAILNRQGQIISDGAVTPSGTLANIRFATQVLAGAVSSAGALARDLFTQRAGTLSIEGVLTRLTPLSRTGSATPAGGLTRSGLKILVGQIFHEVIEDIMYDWISGGGDLTLQAQKSFTGSTTPAGGLNRLAATIQAGVIAPAGNLIRRAQKLLTGVLATAGDLATQLIVGGQEFFQSISGAIGPAADLLRQTQKNPAASLTAAATLTRQAMRSVEGALASSGAALRNNLKDTAGVLSSSGAVSTLKSYVRIFTGSVATSGTLIRQSQTLLSGSLSTDGSVLRRAIRELAGAVTSSSTLGAIRSLLLSVEGILTSSGQSLRQMPKSFTGILSPAISRSRQMDKAFSGVLTPAAFTSAIRTALLALTGVMTAAGAQARQARRERSAAVTITSARIRNTLVSRAGALVTSGQAQSSRLVYVITSASLTLSAQISHAVSRPLTGIITAVGAVGRFARKVLHGSAGFDAEVESLRDQPNIDEVNFIRPGDFYYPQIMEFFDGGKVTLFDDDLWLVQYESSLPYFIRLSRTKYEEYDPTNKWVRYYGPTKVREEMK